MSGVGIASSAVDEVLNGPDVILPTRMVTGPLSSPRFEDISAPLS